MFSYAESDAIARRLNAEVLENVSARFLTTFRGGGTAARVYVLLGADRLAEFLCRNAEKGRNDFYILGGGSNTVMQDGEILRPVVLTTGADDVRVVGETDEGVLITAECGAKIGKVIAAGRKAGAGGLEFLAGVPATTGGALHMNAGAFGNEIADYVVEIERLSPDFAKIEKLTRSDVRFGYRKGVEGTVLRATLLLPKTSEEESRARAAKLLFERRKKQPRQPSCGSVFRRGTLPAGFYIEKAGLKGVRLGGAEISRVHANFIVNTGGASAADFMGLAELAERRVEELFGERLEMEAEIFSDYLPF